MVVDTGLVLHKHQIDTTDLVSSIGKVSQAAPLKRKSERIQRCRPFFEHLCGNRSPQTAEQYAYAAERFLRWLGEQGVDGMATAPRTALADYCHELSARGFLPATINVQLAAIRRYADWLVMREIELPDFFPPPRPRSIPRRVRDKLTDEQRAQYLERADELRDPVKTAAKLLASTGLRSGEIVLLPLRCVKRSVLRLDDGTEKTVFSLRVRGKGDHERVVPVLEEGVEAMRRYQRDWRKEHADAKWLFPGNQNGHIAAHTLRSAVASIRPENVRWTPHTLRRTYLTTLFHDGVPPVILAKIAGHRDVKTLMQHYLALDEDEILKSVHQRPVRA